MVQDTLICHVGKGTNLGASRSGSQQRTMSSIGGKSPGAAGEHEVRPLPRGPRSSLNSASRWGWPSIGHAWHFLEAYLVAMVWLTPRDAPDSGKKRAKEEDAYIMLEFSSVV